MDDPSGTGARSLFGVRAARRPQRCRALGRCGSANSRDAPSIAARDRAKRLPIFPVLLGDSNPAALPPFLSLFQAVSTHQCRNRSISGQASSSWGVMRVGMMSRSNATMVRSPRARSRSTGLSRSASTKSPSRVRLLRLGTTWRGRCQVPRRFRLGTLLAASNPSELG
jgi:hypothetical protein